ncbi:MAG: DUF359 domain-containing protein [Methanobrevibacter sp.]|uniref:GTP-dependent dephospho-CoA kinase family protein n=1 Tax=Methanobrevibacter sp. TaxID=66852 RepID=UPI0026E0D23A|nr:DUF359 domain-containing protein [Methanobrevibacter sp.]MDO5849151.1 DUF359 domain-containing protein [Methanobrevibacter sp.]
MFRLDPDLNKDVISELKKPLGDLYPNFEDALDIITSAKFLISAGDETFNNLIEHNILPDVGIIDNLIQRKSHAHDLSKLDNILKAKNPAGTITENLWETIEKSIELADKGDNQVIVVDGEEDLAVLPCILIAPEDTIVLYGQPNEGLVLLNVSNLKTKAQELLNGFIKE